MRNFKKPLLFSAAMLPVIIPAVILTSFYQIQLYPADAVNQLGSIAALIILSAVQGSLLVAVCCFFGYILADKTGLWKPLYIERDKLFKTIALASSAGLVFSLDYWTFGAYEPLIQSSITGPGLSAAGHLPATVTAFGALTPMLLARCFLLNGGFGLLFGLLYHRYGIWYSMAAHMLVHIVRKAVWLILI